MADRGEVHLVDVLMAFFLAVAYMLLYPFFNQFINMVSGSADPFSSLLLRLIPAVLIIGLFISVGISARRGGA